MKKQISYTMEGAQARVNNLSLINLSPKCLVKPARVQERILRRIIEKRLAQAHHRMSKVMVLNDLELIKWEDYLVDSHRVYNFALQFNN